MEFSFNKQFTDILLSIKSIIDVYRSNLVSDHGTSSNVNVHGESSLKLDLIANHLIIDALSKFDFIYALASEEEDDLIIINDNADYIVCFDPLDGSSLVGTNQGIGLIFAIYNKNKIFKNKLSDSLEFCFYFHLGQVNSFVAADQNHISGYSYYGEVVSPIDIKEFSRTSAYFAPGNLKLMNEESNYFDYFNLKIKNNCKLRYFACLVSDFHFMLCKSQGIFIYLDSKVKNYAKLRLVYEIAPLSLMLNHLNANAINHLGESILDIVPNSIHQTTSVVMGSKDELDLFTEIVLNKLN